MNISFPKKTLINYSNKKMTATNDKIINFTQDKNTLLRLADRRSDNGDVVGALDFLLHYLSKNEDLEVLFEVASLYNELGHFELSNYYLFRYLSIAPKSKMPLAYELIAENLFFVSNFEGCSYYLKLKLDSDGYLDRESIDPEVLEFYTKDDEENKIKLVHPVELADFSKEAERGKIEMARGNYEGALQIFNTIPKGCKAYKENLEQFAVCHFILEEIDVAISYIREMIKLNGESAIAYCHLASMYSALNNQEKSDYYYQKAKSLYVEDGETIYRLAFCAFEKKDGEFACKCMEKIINEREYDVDMRVFYALALINGGRLQKAEEILSFAYRINPSNYVVKYYLELIDRLNDGDDEAKKLLPLKYIVDLPEKEYEDLVANLITLNAQNKKAFRESLKNPKTQNTFEWGISCKNKNLLEACVFTLMKSVSPFSVSLLKKCLILDHVEPGVKRSIIYTLCFEGQREICIEIQGRFNKFKVGSVIIDKTEKDMPFYAGYMSAISLLAITPFSDYQKLALMANKVYLALNKFDQFDADQIGALMVYLLNFNHLNTQKKVCQYFGIKKEKFNEILSTFKGEEP